MVKVSYAEYLTTTGWRIRAWRAKDRAGWRCERCGHDDRPLDTHHLSYARVGDELQEDLIVLCEPCHAEIHGVLLDVIQLRLPFSDTVH